MIYKEEIVQSEFVIDEHLEYLDELRVIGVTNMFGAHSQVANAFSKLTDKEAGKVLTYWMGTFGQ